jgi:hypothetical protein
LVLPQRAREPGEELGPELLPAAWQLEPPRQREAPRVVPQNVLEQPPRERAPALLRHRRQDHRAEASAA